MNEPNEETPELLPCPFCGPKDAPLDRMIGPTTGRKIVRCVLHTVMMPEEEWNIRPGLKTRETDGLIAMMDKGCLRHEDRAARLASHAKLLERRALSAEKERDDAFKREIAAKCLALAHETDLKKLRESKRPFADSMANAVIEGQVRRITELEAKLNGWFAERDALKREVEGLRAQINLKPTQP